MLSQVVGNVDEKVQSFRTVLEPMRQTLKQFKWLGGTKISFADISVAANFLVRSVPAQYLHAFQGNFPGCWLPAVCAACCKMH